MRLASDPATSRTSTTPVPTSISTLSPSLEASVTRLQQQPNYYQQCLPRRAPPQRSPRLLPPRPPMAPTSVCHPFTPRNAVALRARLLHRVCRPILTLHHRHGQRCHHQRESTLSGALRPPHRACDAFPPAPTQNTTTDQSHPYGSI